MRKEKRNRIKIQQYIEITVTQFSLGYANFDLIFKNTNNY